MSVRLGGTGARRQRLGRGTQERKGLGDRRTVAASPAPATALADGAAGPRFRRMILHERPNQLAADSAARCAESASIPPTCAGRRAGSLQFQPARGRTPIAVTLTSARMSPLRPWNAHDQAEPEGVVAGTRQATAPTRCSHALPDLAIAAAPVHPQRALPRARGVHGREPVIRPIRSLPVRRPLRGVAVYVVQTPSVPLLLSDRIRHALAVGRMPREIGLARHALRRVDGGGYRCFGRAGRRGRIPGVRTELTAVPKSAHAPNFPSVVGIHP